MSTDDPRDGQGDETADWPITPPPPVPADDGEATTVLGGSGGSPRWAAAPPPPRPQFPPPPPPPSPPPQRPPPQGRPPQSWSSGPAGPTPPTGPATNPVSGWTPHPGYPPQQGIPSHTGYLPPPPSPVGADPRPSGNRKWYFVGGAAVVAIAVAVAAVLLTRGGGDTTAGPVTTTTAAPTSTTPSTTTTTTPTPVSVAPARLPQLLLPADAISTTLASPGMIPGDVQASSDYTDSLIDPDDCTSAWGPGKESTYIISGFLGMARQLVAEQPTPTHAVVQAVLAFPDATSAMKSYDGQVKSWGDCQSKTISAHVVGGAADQTAVVGAAAEADGMATLQTTPVAGLPGVTCERALTVAGNVVVDVRSCSPDVGDTAGIIARDIATKIDPGR